MPSASSIIEDEETIGLFVFPHSLREVQPSENGNIDEKMEMKMKLNENVNNVKSQTHYMVQVTSTSFGIVPLNRQGSEKCSLSGEVKYITRLGHQKIKFKTLYEEYVRSFSSYESGGDVQEESSSGEYSDSWIIHHAVAEGSFVVISLANEGSSYIGILKINSADFSSSSLHHPRAKLILFQECRSISAIGICRASISDFEKENLKMFEISENSPKGENLRNKNPQNDGIGIFENLIIAVTYWDFNNENNENQIELFYLKFFLKRNIHELLKIESDCGISIKNDKSYKKIITNLFILNTNSVNSEKNANKNISNSQSS